MYSCCLYPCASCQMWKLEKTSLSDPVQKSIARFGFEKPTPVQAATIPLFLSHKDVVVEAVTGSGKTLAFLIPIVEILMKKLASSSISPAPEGITVGALIISPTRELAVQITKILSALLEDVNEKSYILDWISFVGGGDVSADLSRARELKRTAIVVGTPGRLLDLLERGALGVKSLEILVLDEADRLLALGFNHTLGTILESLPKQRRTGLFSATMSAAGLNELVRTGLRNPVSVKVTVKNKFTKEVQALPETLTSYYVVCEYNLRLPWVLSFLRTGLSESANKIIVYFGTCATVEYFSKVVPLLSPSVSEGLPKIYLLHGRMDHKKRIRVFTEFVADSNRSMLFCTDLAARGLDFADVDLVIQYEAPQDPSTFVHRCGRTARSGRAGEAILLLSSHELAYINFLTNRKSPIEPYPLKEELPIHCLFEELRTLNGSDRDLLEKSTNAFVAFFRFYQEHQARFIFNIKELSLGLVAQSYGLMQLPKIKEMKNMKIDFEPSTIDLSSIRFKDKARNKQREASSKAFKERKSIQKESIAQNGRVEKQTRSRETSIDDRVKFGANTQNVIDFDELGDDYREYKKSKKSK